MQIYSNHSKYMYWKEPKSLVLRVDLSSHQSDQKDFLGGTMVENLPASARDAKDMGSSPG